MLDPGGFTPPYTHRLCNALSHRGHDVWLFTAQHGFRFEDISYLHHEFFYRQTQRLFDDTHTVRLFCKGLEHVTDSARLYRVLAHWKPDVIHVQWFPLPVVDRAVLSQLQTIAPVVHTVHDSDPFLAAASSRLQYLGVSQTRNAVDHLIAHTAYTKEQLKEEGISSKSITTIPHGLLHESQPVNCTGPGERRVLFFGSIKPYKDLETLLRAFVKLPASIRGSTLLHVAGQPGMEMDPFRSLATRLGIDDRIVWQLEHVESDSVRQLFEQATVLALPYNRIDQSGVLLTAVGAALPVVASNVGGVEETITDEVHGYLTPPGDSRAFADALERILSNPDHRTQLATAMRELARSWPTWDEIAADTVAVYETLSNGS